MHVRSSMHLAVIASLFLFTWLELSTISGSTAHATANEIQNSGNRVPSAELGRGVNLGGILEAPYEGAWGLTLKREYFQKIKQAGFDHVRLPVSWTYHTARTAPYRIDLAFLRRVDFAVREARRFGLRIIINDHHHDELNENPAAERARTLAIWRQIAARYRNQPDSVMFELLNEPHGAFNDNPALWNRLFRDLLTVVRTTNPTRKILVGPVQWNDIGSLDSLQLPDDDNLIVSVHNYAPFNFTHQGAGWIDPIPPIGERWNGRRVDRLEWENWSYSTATTPTDAGMLVRYQRSGAGYFFYHRRGLNLPLALIFSADRALNLSIEIADDQGGSARISFRTVNQPRTYRIPMSRFGWPSKVNSVLLQNSAGSGVAAWTNPFMTLRTRDGRNSRIVAGQRALLDSWIEQAANWAIQNNRPLHLGEFGAHNRAEYVDRARWTRAVRDSAEARGIDWSYWEFALNFGIYDPDRGRFRNALLRALID